MPFLARSRTRSAYAAALALLLLSAGCASPGPTSGSEAEDTPLQVTVVTMGLMVGSITAEVTATDITTPLLFNLPISQGVATGTIRVSPGDDRTITLRAYDDLGNVTHEGSTTVDVRPGVNPTVNISLRARAGQLPINGTIGSFAVYVSGSDAFVTVGNTEPFVASVLDLSNGTFAPLSPGDIQWAVSNPAFASVNDVGDVTGIAPGELFLVANYNGVAGVTAITVLADIGSVQGTVSSTAGSPLPDVGVVATWAGSSALTSTGQTGSYNLAVIPAGVIVTVSLINVPAGCTAPPAENVIVPTAGAVETLNFEVPCGP